MTFEQIKKLMRYGDYAILGEMLRINTEAAKMRFLRGDIEAKRAMELIVGTRKKMIAEFIKKRKNAPQSWKAFDKTTPFLESWLIGKADLRRLFSISHLQYSLRSNF